MIAILTVIAAALLLLTEESFGHPGLNRQFLVSVLLFVGVLWLSVRRRTNPIHLILASGLIGLVVYSIP